MTDLRNLGHDADTAFDEGLTRVTDPVLIEAAFNESKILLTLDKGIANLKQYPIERHSGVVLFRTLRSGRGTVLTFIRERLPSLLELDLGHRLTTVGVHRIRLRQLELVDAGPVQSGSNLAGSLSGLPALAE